MLNNDQVSETREDLKLLQKIPSRQHRYDLHYLLMNRARSALGVTTVYKYVMRCDVFSCFYVLSKT